jgi:hypothetical protein
MVPDREMSVPYGQRFGLLMRETVSLSLLRFVYHNLQKISVPFTERNDSCFPFGKESGKKDDFAKSNW